METALIVNLRHHFRHKSFVSIRVVHSIIHNETFNTFNMYMQSNYCTKLIGCGEMVRNSPRDWERHSKICPAFIEVQKDYEKDTSLFRARITHLVSYVFLICFNIILF